MFKLKLAHKALSLTLTVALVLALSSLAPLSVYAEHSGKYFSPTATTPIATKAELLESTANTQQYGNTHGNLLNSGLVAESAGWTYISWNGIGRQNNITGEVQLISDDHAEFLNVVGDWVYYCNLSEENALYKIRTDGTKRTKISGDECNALLVVDDWCYYGSDVELAVGDSYYYTLALYKVRTDGTEKTSLFSDGSVYWFAVEDEYIYFSSYIYHSTTYPESTGLYRMKTDGSDVTHIFDGEIFDFQVSGGKVYFSGEFGEGENEIGAIGVFDIDGSDFKIIGEYAESYNVLGDWIYYASDDASNQSVYKMRIDGTEKTLLYGGYTGFDIYRLNISNGWLYLGEADTPAGKIRFDGSLRQSWSKPVTGN